MELPSFPFKIGPNVLILVFCMLILISGALADQSPAAPGDHVEVYYSLSFPGGPVFESNINGSPFSFILSSGAVIRGFDTAIEGMIPGETKTVIIPPEEGYGERNESLIRIIPLKEATDLLKGFNKANVSISLIPGYPGPIIEYLPPEGKRQRYLFTSITNETVVIDTNKPLVGESLQFEITLTNVTKVT
ncbi:MAG TPA: FKBP-type peptidyl-prolyl cis-trans isomerase [Methanospirillum sp.]|nr:FKBP-type peptidyl-prolyl cis-trans isomerase [Methanospirillum sp.]